MTRLLALGALAAISMLGGALLEARPRTTWTLGGPIPCKRDADCAIVPVSHARCPGCCGFCVEEVLVPAGMPAVKCPAVDRRACEGVHCADCPPPPPSQRAVCQAGTCRAVPK
jgi:hypothetical protein